MFALAANNILYTPKCFCVAEYERGVLRVEFSALTSALAESSKFVIVLFPVPADSCNGVSANCICKSCVN